LDNGQDQVLKMTTQEVPPAADSIVNRLANHARTINLGQIDMRRLRHDNTCASNDYWE